MAVTRQPREGITAFSVRRIQHDAWEEGMAAAEAADCCGCNLRYNDDEPVVNPYSDKAHASQREDYCGKCFRCIGNEPSSPGSFLTVGMSMMIVCETCGNKRCPHSTDHNNACTGSNDPGQPGSRYGGM